MCYTPPISFATAAIEFTLAIYMRVRYKQARMAKFGPVFMTLLGSYQFSEFLMCVTPYVELWTKVGFVAYSFLPAVGLHSVLYHLKKKLSHTKIAFIYAVPALAVVGALTPGIMVAQTLCETVFVTSHIFPNTDIGFLAFWAYSVYYAGFIIASTVISFNAYLVNRGRKDRVLFLYYPAAIMSMTIPTFVFLVLVPHFGFRFPSILCHFALLLAAIIFAGVRREEMMRRGA